MNLDEVKNIVCNYPKSIIGELRKQKIDETLKGRQLKIMWDLAFHLKGDSRVPVKCLLDNEYSIYCSSNLVKGNISCDHCLTNKYRELFSDKGFNYLDKFVVKGVVNVVGECFKCKNVVTARSGNLHGKYAIVCQTCEHKRITDALAVKNCEYVSEKLVKHIRRITYKNKDGELLENSQSNILRGSFTSGGSHWKQLHSLYLIKCSFNNEVYFKIGTANSPNQRLSVLKLLGETSVVTLEQFDTRYAASKQEKYLHKLFGKFNLNKELAGTFTDGLSKLGKKAGITEWFSKDILPELEEIYNIKDNPQWHGQIYKRSK